MVSHIPQESPLKLNIEGNKLLVVPLTSNAAVVLIVVFTVDGWTGDYNYCQCIFCSKCAWINPNNKCVLIYSSGLGKYLHENQHHQHAPSCSEFITCYSRKFGTALVEERQCMNLFIGKV